jgi:osmotically-inducible protein OsmY
LGKGKEAKARANRPGDVIVAFCFDGTLRKTGVTSGLEKENGQARWWCRGGNARNSALEFWMERLGLCLVCLLALIVTLGAHAGFTPNPGFAAMQAWLAPYDATGSLKINAAAEKDDTQPRGYTWSATRMDSVIRLRGSVPSEEDRGTVLGMVKAHFPDLEVDDRMKVAPGAPLKEQWLGAVSFGLKQLAHLKRGSARLLNVGLKIEGEARNSADYADAKKALAGPLPTGLTILDDGIKPPIADPFVFVADLSANTLSLSGSVPSEDARKEVRELARQFFERPGLDDRLELASGAPKKWDAAVSAALRALSRLDSGKISLSGLAVTIEGVAPDKGTAVAVSYQLRRDLPRLFSTSESISWKEAAAEPDASRVVPRIKAIAHAKEHLPNGELLPLKPLLESE